MCTGKCSRLVGLTLVTTALLCITANILLMFPKAERHWTPKNITLQVWLLGGLVGGGLMVSTKEGEPPKTASPGTGGRGEQAPGLEGPFLHGTPPAQSL